MQRPTTFHCFASLINLGSRGAAVAPQDVRGAIDRALACDPKVCCSQRLECAWMASELADRLGRRR